MQVGDLVHWREDEEWVKPGHNDEWGVGLVTDVYENSGGRMREVEVLYPKMQGASRTVKQHFMRVISASR
jgi:hypothetical protein